MVRRFLLLASASLSLAAHAQTITLTGGVQKYGSLASTTVNMSNRCELWVTNVATPLTGCTINLNSIDAWLFLPGIKPSVVASTYLGQVRVNGAGAVAGSNVRVVQYGQWGAVVIPQSSSFQPLTVFSEPQFGGTSAAYSQWVYYKGIIGSFSSFKLKRGYQVVFAQSADGKNYSKCYVAQDGDLEIGVLPATLDKQVKFIYVTPWRWTSKKGIAGNPGNSWLNVNWWYDWNIDQSSTSDLEYAAIRWGQSWPSLNQNWHSLGINTLLGYNEPDNTGQANLSVSTAISSWPDLLGTGLRVGSPATTDGGPSSWLIPFVQQADAAGLRVDFVAIHYYQAHAPTDPVGCASQMYNFLLNLWNNTHRPIWVTEWNNGANWTDSEQPPPTYAQQQACISNMVVMLETTPFVERYALYNWVEDSRSLITSSNTVTPAGTFYSNTVSGLSYSQAMPDNGTRGIAQYVFATNTFDTSGYCNNGMAVGAPTYAAGHNSMAQSIVLDGANSYVQLPANIARGNAFTFAAWVYWSGGASWQRIFDFGNDTSHYLFLTPSSGNGTLRFAIDNGSGEQRVERTAALAAGVWQHVAFTLNGSTGILYVNGAQAAISNNLSLAPSSFSPIKNYLGKSQFPDPLFNGKLDEVVIADYAMTPAQISALYTTVPPPSSPYTSGIWTNDADGDWSDTNNWNNGVVANGGTGVNYSGDFSTVNISADRTVTLDSVRGIGTLRFGDPGGTQNWTLAGTSTLTLSAPAPFITVNQNTATISTPLAGTNGFTKTGAGTLVLTGANSFSGTIDVDSGSTSSNDGVLMAAGPGALGNAAAIQFRNSGSGTSALQLDGTSGGLSLPQPISLSGRSSTAPAIESVAGTNTLAGAIGVSGSGNYVVQADAGALNVNGTIGSSDAASHVITFQGNGNANLNGTVANGAGTLSLTKSGTGTLAIGPGSTYSGPTTINQGTLALQPSPAPLLHLTFDNPPGSGAGTIVTNTGLGGPGMNGVIVGTGASIVSGGRFGNALSLNGAGGDASNNIVVVNNKVLDTDASGSWTVAYWMKTLTTGAVVMYQGDGAWSSAGQTTFYLNNNGTTAGTHAGAVRWAGGWLTGTASLNNNAWHFVALVDNAGTESIYVDGNVDAVTSMMADPLASDANQIWIGGSPDPGDGTTKMNGLIDELYMFNRALSQAEVQSLYNDNVITNPPANVLPVTTPLNIASGGIFDLAGLPQTLVSLSGSGIVTNSGNATTLTVSNSSSPDSFTGSLADASAENALSFQKNGNGVFTLAGSNTYRGPTFINGGTLLVNGSIAESAIIVENGGTLGGSGTLGGAVTVQSGGILAPGGGLNALTANNDVTLEPGSATILEISGAPQTNDQLLVSGALTYNGTLVVTNLSGNLAGGDNFQLFQAASINGAFASYSLPSLGAGLVWNMAGLSNGAISVVDATPANLTWNWSGSNLVLSWPPGQTGWRLQVQTNSTGLGTNWVDVPRATLTNQFTLPVNNTSPSVFYRLVYP